MLAETNLYYSNRSLNKILLFLISLEILKIGNVGKKFASKRYRMYINSVYPRSFWLYNDRIFFFCGAIKLTNKTLLVYVGFVTNSLENLKTVVAPS